LRETELANLNSPEEDKFFNYMEVLKWLRKLRKPEKRHLRRKQPRRKNRQQMGVNHRKAITAYAVMAFLFAV